MIDNFAQEMHAPICKGKMATAGVETGKTSVTEIILIRPAGKREGAIDSRRRVIGIPGDPKFSDSGCTIEGARFPTGNLAHDQRTAGTVQDVRNAGLGMTKHDTVGTRITSGCLKSPQLGHSAVAGKIDTVGDGRHICLGQGYTRRIHSFLTLRVRGAEINGNSSGSGQLVSRSLAILARTIVDRLFHIGLFEIQE